jgi:inorganic phosphate transporter, PiT family
LTGPLLLVVVATALLFDFTNGFHDSANAIATSISTRALRPGVALGMAAAANVLGALISTEVAATLGKGVVETSAVTQMVVLAALVGAVTWNFITWYYGIPSSSSHALIGGLVGAVLSAASASDVKWHGILDKVVIPTVISPLIGMVMGALLATALYWTFRNARPATANNGFRHAQTVSAALMAFSHGSNDAQKTMGVISLALLAAGRIDHFFVPLWVKLASALAMGLGTFSGGKRIIRTLGMKLVKLQPIDGFAAETAASAVLLGTAHLGFPVSTTHVITSSIMGVGATKRLSAVKWGVTFNILLAWVLTLPMAAGIAALVYKIIALLQSTSTMSAL